MKTLNIVFMGSPDFAVPSLRVLAESEHRIVGVVTGTDKKRGRGNRLSPTPVKAAALELGLPVIEADQMRNPDLPAKLKSLNPDLFVVVAFKILPETLLSIPEKGSINLHASLLPAYRGAAPIHHAVMNGEAETGCTVFRLDSGIDTGGIIAQESLAIGPNETTGSVYQRMMISGSRLLVKAINRIADETAEYVPQDDSKASPAPKLFDEHCRVSFDREAASVHNQIRGLSPFPCAYAMLDDKKMKLLESRLVDQKAETGRPAGTLFVEDDRVLAVCSPGLVELVTIQPEGKKSMLASDFMRGFKGKPLLKMPIG